MHSIHKLSLLDALHQKPSLANAIQHKAVRPYSTHSFKSHPSLDTLHPKAIPHSTHYIKKPSLADTLLQKPVIDAILAFLSFPHKQETPLCT